MKRYFDEKTGKIVNVLTVEEANRIVKIVIDYFFVDTNMPKGRLNLMSLLRDFIKLASLDDISKFTKYIEEYKQTLKLNKEEQENFAMLYQFFKVYQDYSNENLNIEEAANYILEKRNQKELIEKKDANELTQKEIILKVLFEKGFSFDRLAKVACETWEKKIQDKIKKDKQEVIISIEQEIAYQDLLDFASHASTPTAKKAEDKVVERKEVKSEKSEKDIVGKDMKAENNRDSRIDVPQKTPEVKIQVETKKQDEREIKAEKNNTLEQKKDATIQINHGILEDDVPIRNNPVREEKAQTVATIQINPIIDLEDDVPPRPKKGRDEIENLEEKSKKEAEHKKEEKIPTIQINPFPDDNKDDMNKAENKERVYQYKKEPPITSNIHIFVPGVDDIEKEGLTQNPVKPLEIKKATEDVDLKESVDFFHDVLDDKLTNQNSDDEDSFRD